ncbi:ABC transporter ATP-binding protein [Actibacterium pelagium]|uniref:ABC transporter ATP-binding protein n=1 Tax=Actibacterium pelagium TaxID=2029103 RepID=A0A917EIY5_9RHOB|nr:ABC transporter ATP-binding protein [Actibacterium pelagium]
MSSILPLTVKDAAVRRRGKTLIGPVDLTLGKGGVTIVVGPNGSGKTTLLRMLHGLERLADGTLDWAVPVEAARKRQAFVFQSPILMRRSVRDNLAYPLQLTGTSRSEARQTAEEWARRVGLSDALTRQAMVLSGGERQKLALARALIRDPEMVFLDEPCASLDGRATREIEEILTRAAASGTRLVMSTHDMGQARRLADDVIFMLHGKVHEIGPAAKVLEMPETAQLRAFIKGDIVE